MASLGPKYIPVMCEALTMFHDGARAYIQEYRTIAVNGSMAMTEITTGPDPDAVIAASSIGEQLIDFGGDHISTFVKIMTEPIEVNAACTCVRSMLEACAIAAWLLDPTIDAKTRVGRTFALRYEGMQSELTFTRAVARSKTDTKKLEDRIDAVEQKAIGLGFPRIEDRNQKRIGIGQRMPSATAMIKAMLDEEKSYRLLSAVAHGHSWAIRGLNYVAVTVSDEGSVGTVDVQGIEKTVNVASTGLIGLTAAYAFARPLWSQCRFYGWDALRVEELLENVFDKLQASIAKRFWRTESN